MRQRSRQSRERWFSLRAQFLDRCGIWTTKSGCESAAVGFDVCFDLCRSTRSMAMLRSSRSALVRLAGACRFGSGSASGSASLRGISSVVSDDIRSYFSSSSSTMSPAAAWRSFLYPPVNPSAGVALTPAPAIFCIRSRSYAKRPKKWQGGGYVHASICGISIAGLLFYFSFLLEVVFFTGTVMNLKKFILSFCNVALFLQSLAGCGLSRSFRICRFQGVTSGAVF